MRGLARQGAAASIIRVSSILLPLASWPFFLIFFILSTKKSTSQQKKHNKYFFEKHNFATFVSDM